MAALAGESQQVLVIALFTLDAGKAKHFYTEDNDFIKREALSAQINPTSEISLLEVGQIPLYGRLDRQLAKHRGPWHQ